MNTSQTKLDGTNEPKVNERKLRWDEENRLLAVDDNGFVSQYWYDADGERTVKTSGDGEAVYVNSVFSGGNTQTQKFTLYVSPYLVASQGGRYTKHIYIGSQRIVSKLGDFASYGSDPRMIPYAGSESDNITVDYANKYQEQLQSIKDNYQYFEVPYNGVDNDDYVNGQGFCCDNPSGYPEGEVRNFDPGENINYEHAQFYYHPDHLGSSSFITNLDGDITQHIEYVPFGEVFVEERNNVWNTPYLFNAKEFDEETGLYYYGARYYDSRISLWISVDPLAEKYPDMSSYTYVANNPSNAVDPNGRDILFINGFIGFGSPPAGEAYWSSSFVSGAKSYFKDNNVKFTNYAPSMLSSAADRKAAGLKYAKNNFADLTKGMAKDKDVFRLVTHSMGAAFGEGVAEYLKAEGWKVETIVHINPFQANDITTTDPNSNAETKTIDYQNPDDWVINNTPTASPGNIKGADSKIREKSGDDNWKTRHMSPIWKQGDNFWKELNKKIFKSGFIDSPISNPIKNDKLNNG